MTRRPTSASTSRVRTSRSSTGTDQYDFAGGDRRARIMAVTMDGMSEPAGAPSGPAADPSARGRILVVDDDASLAEMLTIVLRQEGFESKMVSRGDEAMDEFRDYRPDLVLLDLMLPGKDGIDVCKEIRAESGVPIVMLTAKS